MSRVTRFLSRPFFRRLGGVRLISKMQGSLWTPPMLHKSLLCRPISISGTQLRSISTESNEYKKFCEDAFMLFDLNGDDVIEPYEIEEAYKFKGAGAELTRLIEKNNLGGKGVTWESLDLLDLVKASKDGKVSFNPDGNIEREAFSAWLTSALDEFKKMESSLDGAQIEHE